MTECDRLIPQVNITMNLLCTSCVNPKLSSYAYIIGNLQHQRAPINPSWQKMVLHKKLDQRASWEYHGMEAFYAGPSLDHYRCFQCYVPSFN